ncbi:hypothetical protein Q4Q54_09175 [Shewanella sp. SP2S2-4]|nr:hypothetical protein [Shewanella sp. SP2S2-4]MCS6129330.1 hypothetical protein [Shewanella baltica]MCS6141357.1 hypothetical protein [Shewanella baltica]MCS6147597.1 hypothetical protein [Shewanella baltica]MCS6172171.1 hypothetical protein [Shewanella baltica]MCS6189351.1 hypothetical protein [Shewanella baltica]
MSEYQYYRFECVNSSLSVPQRNRLRNISSRAEITSHSFCVQYHYGDLSADPEALMMDFFDIGFYYTNWGQVNAYLKLPAGTIPCDFKVINADFYVSFVENKQSQLLIFTLEDDYRYRDDESAESFMLHLVALRTELLTGDYRALYFHWLSQANDDMALEPLPLIAFDFHQLTQAQLAFTTLFDIPLPSIRALHLLLQSMPAHVPQPTVLTAQQQVAKLTDAEKDALLCCLFDEGKIFAADAYALLRTQETPIEYSDWVTVASLHPFWHVAEKEVMQEERMAEAERLARETLLRNEHLEAVYKAHQSHWDSAFEEAARGCASGYDNAGRTLQVLFDAYQLKQSSSEFKQNFDVFISKNKQRKALIKRLEPLQKIMLSL